MLSFVMNEAMRDLRRAGRIGERVLHLLAIGLEARFLADDRRVDARDR